MSKLYSPLSYRSASLTEKSIHCNGCGPMGWKGSLVPNTIYGLDISEACNIHDWMYYEGISKEDADTVFYDNMVALIDNGSWFLGVPRRFRAKGYYLAVKNFGGKHFGK